MGLFTSDSDDFDEIFGGGFTSSDDDLFSEALAFSSPDDGFTSIKNNILEDCKKELSKCHSNIAYFFKVVDKDLADMITKDINKVPFPITLYNSPEEAWLEAKGFKFLICLRFSVDMKFESIKGNYVYDESLPDILKYVEHLGVTLEEYKHDCGYIRYLSKLGDQKVMACQINNLSRIQEVQFLKDTEYIKLKLN